MSWNSVVDWRSRLGVHMLRPDPYCVWASITSWIDYPPSDPDGSELPWHCRLAERIRVLLGVRSSRACIDGRAPVERTRAVIIELNHAKDLDEFLRRTRGNDVIVPREYKSDSTKPHEGKYITACVSREGLRQLADGSARAPGELVARFDLCDFIEPGPFSITQSSSGGKPTPRPTLNGTKLIGIIDDGCAFAHASFLTGGATRVAALWDQDNEPAFKGLCETKTDCYGTAPYRFPYGWEMWRDDAGGKEVLGLNRWIDRYSSGDTPVDEDACYEEAACASMRPRAVHGPHVMDILAGPRRIRDRIYVERDEPPTWGLEPPGRLDAAADPAQSDIVFVQLPRAGLRDMSGGWLDSHVLDAVRFVLSCRASSTATDQTVVNVSYGTSVGPHDESSILAKALDALVAREPAGELQVVLAAGNSFSARGHAAFRILQGAQVTLCWRVLPGSEMPGFLQLWLPAGSDVQISVTPAGARGSDPVWMRADSVSVWPSLAQPSAAVLYLEASSRGDGAMILIAIAPTAVETLGRRPAAPHGDWSINLRSAAGIESVHAYIARNDTGVGSKRRGRQSYFVDARDEADKYLRSANDDPDRGNLEDDHLYGVGSRVDTQVRRRGTINGIATGRSPVVVAGYQRNFTDDPDKGKHAPYSSAGMEGDPRGRGPTTSVPTDESAVLKGIRAAGSRSGSSFRLVGTSSAAPQRARTLLNPRVPPIRRSPPTCDVDLYGEECKRPVSKPI
jgi:hypothetical protein